MNEDGFTNDVLRLASRLHRNNIPHYLCQDKDGWTVMIFQSTGVVFGKRAMMFTQNSDSLDSNKGLIEVFTGNETISYYRERGELDEHLYSMSFEGCYEMVMEWCMRRYDDINN